MLFPFLLVFLYTSHGQFIKNVSTCDYIWPDMTFFLPIRISTSAEIAVQKRVWEWEAVFMQTFLFFWPLRAVKPKLLFMLDEEEVIHKNKVDDQKCKMSSHSQIPVSTGCHSSDYKRFTKRLTDYRKRFNGTGLQLLVDTNSERQFPRKAWIEGHSRSQLVGFYADQYMYSEFIAFVDADCFWTSYVDYQDLFASGGRPVVMGKFDEGDMFTPSSTWILGGLPPPLSFMHYFPVIIRRAHVREIREYIERIHGKDLVKVFQQYRAKFGVNSIGNFYASHLFLYLMYNILISNLTSSALGRHVYLPLAHASI